MATNQSREQESLPYSTLEVGSPIYSTLELDPKRSHLSSSLEVREIQHTARPHLAPLGDIHSPTWQGNAAQELDGQEKTSRRKMIFGMPLRWFLILIAVIVVSVAGGVAGGVLGSKSSSAGSKAENFGDQNNPASTVIDATLTSAIKSLDTAITSTSGASTPSTLVGPNAAVETLFKTGKYYNILNDFVLSNSKVSALRCNVTDDFWNNALGLEERSAGSARQQWTFEPVPASWANASIPNPNPNSKAELVAAYWIYSREFGRQRLYVKGETERIERGFELALLFAPEDNADKQQYWYITRSLDDGLYFELRNWKLGGLWALAAHETWWTPQMGRLERVEGGSRKWLIPDPDLY